MKKRAWKVLLLIETFVLAIEALCVCVSLVTYKRIDLFREVSPDGGYVLLIQELGTPDWPFGSDLLKITLYENNNNLHYSASFRADVSNNGMQAIYKVEWLEEGVQIALMGSGQNTAYYILPFKTLDD